MTEDICSRREPGLTNDSETRFIAEVVQRLVDGHSVALSAPSQARITPGIVRELRTRGAFITRVDVSTVDNIEEFARVLILSAIENNSASVPEPVHLEPHPEDGKVDPMEFLDYAIHVPELVAELDDRRMVVVLEEFHELTRLGGDELLKRLRAWFQRHVYTTYLFVSSQAGRMQPLMSERQQAFYRFAVMLEWPQT